MLYNLFATPKLTKPVAVFNPTKTVEQNMAGQGSPSVSNMASAYQTPQAKLQMQQVNVPQTPVEKPQPTVDPTSSTSGIDLLASQITTPEDEEKMRKASVMNQRILAVGDALRHIGNIYHTANGAPAQQFNNPVNEEYTRYQQGKAMRDKANQVYLTYRQQKALQDARAKQLENELEYKKNSLDFRRQQEERYNKMYDLNVRKQDHKENNDERLYELKKMHEEGIITKAQMDNAVKWYNAYSNRMRAEKYQPGGVGEYGVYEEKTKTEDKNGNIKWTLHKSRTRKDGTTESSTTTRTTEKGKSSTPSKATDKSQNTPPSRRGDSSNNSNVPPSRRKK